MQYESSYSVILIIILLKINFKILVLFSNDLATETLREVPSNFQKFYSEHKYISPEWLDWFIGFLEGDGGLHVHKGRIYVTITQKERQVLDEIKLILGFGHVKFDASMNCYRYLVQNIESCYILALLLNGNLVQQHRVNQLKNCISILKEKGYNIDHIDICRVPTHNDSWVSGFTDAEGCFNLVILKRTSSRTGYRPIIRFTLGQRDERALLLIRDIFGFGSVSEVKSINPGYFRYTINSIKNSLSIVEYYRRFPLKTKKALAFDKWCEIRTKLINKDHLSIEGLEIIAKLGKLINKVNSEINLKKD